MIGRARTGYHRVLGTEFFFFLLGGLEIGWDWNNLQRTVLDEGGVQSLVSSLKSKLLDHTLEHFGPGGDCPKQIG